MDHQNKSFKEWKMPGKDTGITPNVVFFADRDNYDIEHAKQLLHTTYGQYNDLLARYKKEKKFPDSKKKEETKAMLQDIRKQMQIDKDELSDKLWDIFHSSLTGGVSEVEHEENMTLNEWNWKKASTLVHHVMRETSSDGTVSKMDSSLIYLLQDPLNGLGSNLVAPFRSSETNEFYEANMLWMWERLKAFIMTDAGELVVETLADNLDERDFEREDDYHTRHSSYSLARRQMMMLKTIMSTATRISEPTGHNLGVKFMGDRFKSMKWVYETGTVEMQVWDSIPDFSDIDPILFPPEITNLVSGIYQSWKDASPGVFVSIIWNSTQNESGQHYMYLTEYNKKKVHASVASGWESAWMQRTEEGMPVFEEREVALDSFVRLYPYEKHIVDGNGQVIQSIMKTKSSIHPFNEENLMDFLVDYILTASNITADDIERMWDSYTQELPESEEIDKNKRREIMKPYCYVGNSFAFLVLSFDTSSTFVRDLFGITPEILHEGAYIASLVLRYPVININVDKTMSAVRYKYFMRNTSPEDHNKFSDWLHGRWFIRLREQQGLDENQYAEKFQVTPNPTDRLDWIKEEDRHNNLRYSLRLPAYVPQHASLEYLMSKRRHMQDDFFVNGLETDPDISYVYSPDHDATWDELQLFRMQAEVKVSRKGFSLHGESFFTYKSKNLPVETRGLHPFGLYLIKYPGLRDEWKKIWHEKWPEMEGWDRISLEERREANRAERDDQERPERQRAEPQRQHRGRQGRNQPAERRQRAGQRGQNRRPVHRPGARPQAQKQGKGRRARRRERANGGRPQQRAALRWPTNFKRVLSERRQNEKFLMHMTCPSFTPQ